MLLKDLFAPKDFVIAFDPADKWEAIRQLMEHMVDVGRIQRSEFETLQEAVMAREKSMSTGMERGISIPHAAVDDIEEVRACIGIVSRSEGLAFESIDGRPTQLIVLLVIPRAQKLLHIRTLADIARVLGKDSVREAFLAASSGEEAWHALSEGEAANPA